MPAIIEWLSGGLVGSSGPAWANKFLAGLSKHKLDSFVITDTNLLNLQPTGCVNKQQRGLVPYMKYEKNI
jgi:hypothetical protein